MKMQEFHHNCTYYDVEQNSHFIEDGVHHFQIDEDNFIIEAWFKNGQFHREGGPAIQNSDGTLEWWFDGMEHRDDGPAIESPNGQKAWFFEGRVMTVNEWLEKVCEKDSSLGTLMKLQWG